MTSAMDIPLHGKIKLYETSKTELLDLWQGLISMFEIPIIENTKVESVEEQKGIFKVSTKNGKEYTASKILLTIGRRGSPRKLNIPGENLEKVAYRLLEPENISNKNILVVGGGDSAIESALILADNNKVTVSYRSGVFNRLKPKNNEKIQQAIAQGQLTVIFNSQPTEITSASVLLKLSGNKEEIVLENDLIFIFAGGELPTAFLRKIGLDITKKHGEALLKH